MLVQGKQARPYWHSDSVAPTWKIPNCLTIQRRLVKPMQEWELMPRTLFSLFLPYPFVVQLRYGLRQACVCCVCADQRSAQLSFSLFARLLIYILSRVYSCYLFIPYGTERRNQFVNCVLLFHSERNSWIIYLWMLLDHILRDEKSVAGGGTGLALTLLMWCHARKQQTKNIFLKIG